MKRELTRAGLLAMVLLATPAAEAQGPDTTYTGLLGIELRVRERWMHEGQRSRFTPYFTEDHSFVLDSVRAPRESGERIHYLSFGRLPTFQTDRGRIVVDSMGRVTEHDVTPVNRTAPSVVGDEFVYFTVVPTTERFWDLLPSFRPRSLQSGATWVDTLDRSATAMSKLGPVRRSMRGIRWSWLVRDTVVDGRAAWVVRDSARVVLDESWPLEDYLADSPLPLTRSASGVTRGVAVVDVENRIALVRTDTTRLSGSATLQDAYGRTLRSGAHYDRVRSWMSVSIERYPAIVRARLDAEDRLASRKSGEPGDVTGERIKRGDVAARDSVFALWRASEDPDENERMYHQLSWANDEMFKTRVWRSRVALGDTNAHLRTLQYHSTGSIPTWTTERVRRLTAALERPEWIFKHGVYGGERLEARLHDGLATFPPSVSDSLQSPCTRDGCRLLARFRPSAGNEQLRDLALYARAMMEPKRYVDSVRERAKVQRRYFEPIMRLLGEPSKPNAWWFVGRLPAENAGWSEWSRWLPSEYHPSLRVHRDDWLYGLRQWDRGVRLRFLALAEGRDLRSEFRRALRVADGDSAPPVFAGLLLAAGEPPRSLDTLAWLFRNGSTRDVEIAHVEFELHLQRDLREREARRANGRRSRIGETTVGDSATLAFEAFVDSMVAREYVASADSIAHFVNTHSLPTRVAERWREFSISDSAWSALPSSRRARRTSIFARRLGPFVIYSLTSEERWPEGSGGRRRSPRSVLPRVMVPWDGGWRVLKSNISTIISWTAPSSPRPLHQDLRHPKIMRIASSDREMS